MCFKRYTKTPPIVNFGNPTGDFHMTAICFRQQYKILVLSSFTQHFVLVSIFEFTPIYPFPVFALHISLPGRACASYCIYSVVVFTFTFSSQQLTLPFLTFSILHCRIVFAVIRFLVPLHLHILYLAFVSNYFEFLFQ